MASQSVANNPIGSYQVAVTKLADNSEVQSVNALLPFISNQDVVDATTTYTGYALRGASDADASWFIMKSVITGTVTSIRFASDPFVFDQIWANRAALSYT